MSAILLFYENKNNKIVGKKRRHVFFWKMSAILLFLVENNHFPKLFDTFCIKICHKYDFEKI